MSIHQLMLENAFEAFSHHILIFGRAKHTLILDIDNGGDLGSGKS